MIRIMLVVIALVIPNCARQNTAIEGAKDIVDDDNSRTKSSRVSTPMARPSTLSNIDAFLARETEKLEVPAVAVGIIKNGELASVNGYGTSKLAASISAKSVFRLGSITKVITSAAILHLRDADKLSLEDPVAKFVPELKKILAPEGLEPVRLKHLLRHRSGIPTLGDGTLNWSTHTTPISEKQLLDSIRNSKLGFSPGDKFDYSNVGMALAGVVVARASETSYRDYVDRHLLAPLGMASTRWDRTAYSENAVVPGYIRKENGFEAVSNHRVLGAIESAGGLYSTIEDMAKFISFESNPPLSGGVLSASTIQESQTKSKAQDQSPGGLGWMIHEDPELGKIGWHNGATAAYGAWVGIDSERHSGVVLFVSTGETRAVDHMRNMGLDILRLLAGHGATYSKASKLEKTTGANQQELIEQTASRVLTMLNNSEELVMEKNFDDQFLQKLPPDHIKNFLKATHEQYGDCNRYESVQGSRPGNLQLKLFCEKGVLEVKLVVQASSPHLIQGMLIQPSNQPD